MKDKKQPLDFEAAQALDNRVYRLKISLVDTLPAIWRRIEVYGGITMDSLASAIDDVFGWSGEHLGEFDIKGLVLGDRSGWTLEAAEKTQDPNPFPELLDQFQHIRQGKGTKQEKKQLTTDLLNKFLQKMDQESEVEPEPELEDIPVLWEMVPRVRTKFTYTYDFGDNWKHQIEVEKILPAEPGIQYPRLTAGERANPIEDCGGPWALEGLIEALGHPDHECYWQLEEWGLENWDPAQFDAEKTNRILVKTFRLRKKTGKRS